MAPKNEDKYVELPLSEVVADPSWNLRSGNWRDATPKDGEMSFAQLKDSIKDRGQDEAIKVRPKGKKFDVMAGFRRYYAILDLAEAKAVPATIKAVVKQGISDAEARSINIRENMRDPIPVPDLAWALFDLLQKKVAETKQEPTDRAIATEVGLSEGYVNQLLTIMRQVHPKVTKAWRESGPVQVSLAEMRVIANEKEKAVHWDLYQKALAKKADAPKGRGSWITTAIRQAEHIGHVLGTLKREGVVRVEEARIGDRFDWLGIKMGKEPSPAQIRTVGEALAKTYIEASQGQASTASLMAEDDEDEDEDERGAAQ